jgi:hypothetical protein
MGIMRRDLAGLGLAISVGDGQVSRDEMFGFVRAQVSDPDWPSRPRRLADLTTVSSDLTAVDAEGAAELYRFAHVDLRGARQAIVASRQWDLAAEFERQHAATGVTTIACNSLETACVWLGVDLGTVRAAVRDLRAQLRDR